MHAQSVSDLDYDIDHQIHLCSSQMKKVQSSIFIAICTKIIQCQYPKAKASAMHITKYEEQKFETINEKYVEFDA